MAGALVPDTDVLSDMAATSASCEICARGSDMDLSASDGTFVVGKATADPSDPTWLVDVGLGGVLLGGYVGIRAGMRKTWQGGHRATPSARQLRDFRCLQTRGAGKWQAH